MKAAIGTLVLLCFATLAAAGVPPEFESIVLANRYSLQVTTEGATGLGVERLIKEGESTDIFMFGENHGAAEIATLAARLYSGVSETRPRRLVTEIGPATAAEVEEMVRANSFKEFMAEGIHLQSVPFFFFSNEVPLLEKVVTAIPAGLPAIWGVDQEFMGGAPIVLKHLAKLAKNADEVHAVRSAERSSILNPFLFGMGSGDALESLKSQFSTSANFDAEALAEQLVLGFKLYKAQTNDNEGWSNNEREKLMSSNFFRYTAGMSEKTGPLFFKMGMFHLVRGNPIEYGVQESFGTSVANWAQAHGLAITSVFVDCRGGELRDALFGMAQSCDSYLHDDSDIFGDALVDGGSTLFDLRPLRNAPSFQTLPAHTRNVINGYDYYVVLPNTHASTFLPGSFVTRVYLGTMAAIVIMLLSAVVWWFIRWLRRRRLARAIREDLKNAVRVAGD